jgi:hypothetical protein
VGLIQTDVSLKIETHSSETSVYNKPTQRHIHGDGILHGHSRDNLKSYIALHCYNSITRAVSSVELVTTGTTLPQPTFHAKQMQIIWITVHLFFSCLLLQAFPQHYITYLILNLEDPSTSAYCCRTSQMFPTLSCSNHSRSIRSCSPLAT